MKLFECQNCGQRLYFENTHCENCGQRLGYLSDSAEVSALTPAGGDQWSALAAPGGAFRFCTNAAQDACNWLVPVDSGDTFCRACDLNRTIPDLEVPGNLLLWQRMEAGKHRLVYTLLRLGLPLSSKHDDPTKGLAFDFLSDAGTAFQEGPKVMTGHAEGLITINLAEADDAERERHRQDMAETYRTILGHFRHESGHHYWERLIADGAWLAPCRELFGDDRRDYGDALKDHYAKGPPADWREHFISTYASSHPWEDFAETWAHYLHLVDTLETAAAFGVGVHAKAGRLVPLDMEVDFDPYRQEDFDALLAAWLPLTTAVNSLNQSMGQPDLYPFVMAPEVARKMRFIHDVIQRAAG